MPKENSRIPYEELCHGKVKRKDKIKVLLINIIILCSLMLGAAVVYYGALIEEAEIIEAEDGI